MKKIKKIKTSILILAVIALILAYIAIVGVLIYGFGLDNVITKNTAKIIPYPAVVMDNGKIITVSEVNKKLKAIKMFYLNQDFSDMGLRVDFETENGKKRLKIKEKDLINKLIENRVIEKLANKRGIRITDTMVTQEVNRKMQEYGTGEYLKDTMFRLYGWQIEDFEKNIVKPDLYKEKLKENVVKNSESFVKARGEVKKAQADLESGKSFGETAKKYSMGESKESGGEMGWFSYDQITPEIASAAYLMQPGEVSDMIESSLGYHIIKVEDKKTEDEKELVKISQIFIRTEDFGDWLRAQMKSFRVYVPLGEYIWDKNLGEVDFSKEDMREFEKNEFNNPSGDASIMLF